MPTRRRMSTLVTVVAAVIVLAGCSSKQAGSPNPVPTGGGDTGTSETSEPTTRTSAEPPTGNGAPKVNNPLDASKFLAQPCSALSVSALRTLNLPAQGKPDTDSQVARTAGPSCLWQNSDTPSSVGVGFLSGNKNGLDDTYRGHKQGSFKGYFEPTDVDGYPAVFNDAGDYRDTGTCNITVGISDTLAFRAAESGRLGRKSCDRAKEVAAAVIQTLKGA